MASWDLSSEVLNRLADELRQATRSHITTSRVPLLTASPLVTGYTWPGLLTIPEPTELPEPQPVPVYLYNDPSFGPMP